ncbi:MAG: MFS transporter [Erysipelotrichaceae bacterium]|nr:MFS transporter [Erysipelotrichaceae bacterium]
MKNNLILKIALLSCCFVTASVNAVAGNIPAMAEAFPNVPLSLIELLTTIPSLFSMAAVLISNKIASAIGYKKTVLAGCISSAAAGTIPVILNNVYLILIARAIFGFGCGLISSSLLILIVRFFEGEERSQMIGLQGSAGGLASLVTTFVAGRLLVYGWNVSFLVYLCGFAVFLLVLFFIPHTGSIRTSAADNAEHKGKLNLYFNGLVMFVSVLTATLFVIKCASLASMKDISGSSTGSLLVMCISAGSMIAGAIYGKMTAHLKKISLAVFDLICALGFVAASFASGFFMIALGAFLLGFGYLAFVPYLQESVSSYGAEGTAAVLVFQGLGAFAAPYLGSLLSIFSESLSVQFILAAGIFVILALIAFVTEGRKATA